MTNFHNLLTLDNKLLQTDVSSSFLSVYVSCLLLLYTRRATQTCSSVSTTTQDEEEAGLLEMLKSQICDNAALYAQKYDEEFQPYLPRFVTAIWNLLVSTGQEVKYDLVRLPSHSSFSPDVSAFTPLLYLLPLIVLYGLCVAQLVSNAIQFLASVCERPHYKNLFEDQNTLTSICEKVIVPNMEFRSKSVWCFCFGFFKPPQFTLL